MANKHFGLWPAIDPTSLGASDLMLVGRAADSQIYRLDRGGVLTWLLNGLSPYVVVAQRFETANSHTLYSVGPSSIGLRVGSAGPYFGFMPSNLDSVVPMLNGGGAVTIGINSVERFRMTGDGLQVCMGSLVNGTTSTIQTDGDFSIAGEPRAISGNVYYAGGYKYYRNGYAFSLRSSGTGRLDVYGFANNAGGANAAATPLALVSFDLVGGHFKPLNDNITDLGDALKRWRTIFAGTGVINTSGRDAKRTIVALRGTALSDEEPEKVKAAKRLRVGARLARRISSWQFQDSIAEKGQEAYDALPPEQQAQTTPEAEGLKVARYHVGFVFDEVVADFEAEGLDPYREAAVCRDKKMVRSTIQELGQIQEEIVESYEEWETVVDPANPARGLRQKVTRTRAVKQWRDIPVFDSETGAPIMVPSGRFLDLMDSGGNPLPDMVQEKHRLPKMIPAMVSREVETWDGVSYVEALRENHLYALAIAALAAGVTIEPGV